MNGADRTYYLMQDLTGPDVQELGGKGCMVFQASGITLDCQGHKIIADSAINGVYLNYGSDNAEIKNCIIESPGANGIFIDTKVKSCYKQGSRWKCDNHGPKQVHIHNNNISNSSNGILIRPFSSSRHLIEHNIIANNSKDGIHQETYKSPYQRSDSYTYYSTSNTYRHNTIVNNYRGIYNYRNKYDKIEYNNLSFNSHSGIYFHSQANNFYLRHNFINNNGEHGVYLNLGYHWDIHNNTIMNNQNVGMYIFQCGFQDIKDNKIMNNKYGINTNCWDNDFNNNIICGNSYIDFKCKDHSMFSYSFKGTGNTIGNLTTCEDDKPELNVEYTTNCP
jgi:hypothetical protein